MGRGQTMKNSIKIKQIIVVNKAEIFVQKING
jgi:hypothetical protein